jgi:heat shock protein HslJ
MALNPRWLILAALVASLCVVVACAGTASEQGAGGGEETAASTAKLEGATWALVGLAGAPAALTEQHPVPELRLDAEGKRATGSGGCNRFSGGYERDGERLSFGPLAATKRYCGGGMELEDGFFAALGKVARWRIADNGRLQLLDADGTTVAELEARPEP